MTRVISLFLLVLLAAGCRTAWPSDPALQILCRLHTEAIPPDEYSWIRLTDGKTGKSWRAFWFAGGTPSTMDGAVGYFDKRRILVKTAHVAHLDRLVGRTSVMGRDDSLVLATLDGYGTGVRYESLVILTLYDGEWRESFRCDGYSFSSGGEAYEVDECTVNLQLTRSPSGGQRRLVRKVKECHYPTAADYDANQPSVTKSFSDMFIFDLSKMRFVADTQS